LLRSVASLVLSVVLAASCGSTPSPSPGSSAETPSATPSAITSAAPSATAVPTPLPTPTPPLPARESAWPLTVKTEREIAPVFGADGTAYLLTGGQDAQLIALDRGGHMMPGWPIEEGPAVDFGAPAVGPDGSVYLEACAGPVVGCVLHRLDRNGRDRTGWPIAIPSDFACSVDGRCMPNAVVLGPDGTTFVSHWRESGGLQVLAIDPAGRIKPGWPVAPAVGLYWRDLQVGSDGTLFAFSQFDADGTSAGIAAFRSDGSVRPGWPVHVPDASGFTLGPQGSVVVWSYVDDVGELCLSPRRTVFTVLGPDGRTLSGWPRGSTGLASVPAIDDDGTLYYVSATYKVYAHDRAGEVRPGWPVAVPGARNACGPERPHLAPDGTLFVVGDEIAVLSLDGHPLPGWPHRPTGSLVGPCFDSECYGGHRDLAFGPDGTAYFTVYHGDTGSVRAEVVAIDRKGQIKPGWPYRLPFDANTVEVGLTTISPDGRVIVRGGGFSPYVLIALDSEGRLAR